MILSELLTGKQPFDGLPQNQLRRKVLEGERPALTGVTGVPSALQTMIRDCMAHTPEQRPIADTCVSSLDACKTAALASIRRVTVVPA
jgi:Protein tyrosine and serine/threonine kinase